MRIVSTLIILATFLFISCEGSTGIPGPPGPQGPPGEDGFDGVIGQVFEAEVDFNKGNGYEELVEIPTDIEVYESDIIMCYILVGTDNGLDIWEPLPQTLFFDDGILLYGFDHTQYDVNFFLDGTVDLGGLDPFYTDDIIFRIAIIPADYAKSIDVNKFENVMSALEIQEIKRIN